MKKLLSLSSAILFSMLLSGQTTGHFTMDVKAFKNDQPDPKKNTVIEYHFNGSEVAFVLPDSKNKTIIIMNPQTRVSTTLIDDGKSKTGTKMKLPNLLLGKDDPGKTYTVTATDESKVIDGYNCRKYLFENEDYTGYIWVTNDIKWPYAEMANLFGKMLGSQNSSFIKINGDLTGFPILAWQKEKKGKDSFETSYKNIETGKYNQVLFDTTGYEVTDMTQFMK